MFLNFEHFFCLSNVHHSFPKLENIFVLMIISAKKVEIGTFHSNYIYLAQMCFWPSKLQFWIMCFYEKLFNFLCGGVHG
jgi:hypothetical protein